MRRRCNGLRMRLRRFGVRVGRVFRTDVRLTRETFCLNAEINLNTAEILPKINAKSPFELFTINLNYKVADLNFVLVQQMRESTAALQIRRIFSS